MNTKIKTVYYCDHCKKHGLSKPAMERHELICKSNPANFRPCFDCVNLTKKYVTIYDGADSERDVSVFYCRAVNKCLHTPQNANKGNMFVIGDYSNEPMPLQCNEQITFERYERDNFKDLPW
jgi:hypothetical protein